jgi:hypothetical protein
MIQRQHDHCILRFWFDMERNLFSSDKFSHIDDIENCICNGLAEVVY